MKIADVDKSMDKHKDSEFMHTNLEKLDKILDGGFLKKELVILGAGTGIGKSYVAGHILWQIAQQGFSTAYYSLEISNAMVYSRLLAPYVDVSPTKLLYGLIDKETQEKKTKARAKLLAHSEFIDLYDDIYDLDTMIKVSKEKKHEFIIIDFLQNVMHKSNDEYTRLSEVSYALQRFAKENDSCVLALSQLSNQAIRNKKAGLLEYKGSGSIATVADVGLFLERGELQDQENYNNIRLKMAKNRRGTSGHEIAMTFIHPSGKIL